MSISAPPIGRPRRRTRSVWWIVPAAAADIALATSGPLILWHNGGETVLSGPAAGIVLFCATLVLLLVVRAGLTGRLAQFSPPPLGTGGELTLVVIDIAGLVGSCAWWLLSGDYLIGWISLYCAVLVGVTSPLQLLADLLVGRNEVAGRRADRGSLFLSAARVVAGVTAVVVIALTAAVHEWGSAVLNPLILLVLIALGVSSLLSNGVGSVRRRA